MVKIYTWNEIKKQNLLVANNNVYDVSKLRDKHPGGNKALLKNIGLDCTIDYNFHSKESKKKWNNFKVGELPKKTCCTIM
tara:strand:- start:172 stop:411 length:240 start_codon:yes stop_codon:yes gene_type:complete